MTEEYSRDLNKVKRLEPELTGDNLLWFNPAMARPSPKAVQEIARRLTATREALNLDKAELCRIAGIAPNAYSAWEPTKKRPYATGRPELDQAMKLCDAHGYTLDWIYRGNPVGLPYNITSKLDPSFLGAQPAMSSRRRVA